MGEIELDIFRIANVIQRRFAKRIRVKAKLIGAHPGILGQQAPQEYMGGHIAVTIDLAVKALRFSTLAMRK